MQNINSVGKGLTKLFRYGTVTCGVLMGFVLSFFMFSYYDAAKRIDANESNDRIEYRYANSIAYFVYGKDIDLDNIEYQSLGGCDAVIMDMLLYVGDNEYPRTADVVMHSDELIYPLVKGRYPNEQDMKSGNPCVVLGKSLKRDTYNRDGNDYIKINGDEYNVTGYVSAESSAIFDFKVILYYDCIGAGALKDVEYYKNNAGIFFVVSSDSDISEYVSMLDNYVETYPDNFYEVDYEPFKFGNPVNMQSRKMAVLIYMSSIIIVVLSVIYWYINNKKEFAIRRAHGYSRINIILLISKRLIGILFISMVICELLIIAVNRLGGAFEVLNAGEVIDQIKMMLKYIAVTIPLVLIFPVAHVFADAPDALIRESD